jgi:hypothetical protein
MIILLAAFFCGLLFGWGLQISGMTDPNKIFGFLDFFGAWDPSLAVVMAVAVITTAAGYALARHRGKPVLTGKNAWPTKSEIDRPLMIGSLVFGTGWGLVGLCPGPSIVNLTTLSPRVGAFVVAVAVGMIAVDRWQNRHVARSQTGSEVGSPAHS